MTMDPACVAPEEGAESGEMETWSKRPIMQPKRQRVRNWERKVGDRQCSENTLHIVLHFPATATATASAAAAETAAAPAAIRIHQ